MRIYDIVVSDGDGQGNSVHLVITSTPSIKAFRCGIDGSVSATLCSNGQR
jgi:hypothetical protein